MKPCMYCTRPAPKRVGASENEQLNEDLHICDSCWELLKKPETALPFLRGHLSQSLRGQVPTSELKNQLNEFMGVISEFHKKN